MSDCKKMDVSNKILIVSQFYAPDIIGAAKYTSELAEALANRGWEVEVIAPPPFYPGWRRHAGYHWFDWRTEIIENVTVRRVPVIIPRTPHGLLRIIHQLTFALTGGIRVLIRSVRFRPSIIFTVAPSIANAPLNIFASKIVGAKSWLHVQDFEVDAAFGLGVLTGNWKKTLAQLLESKVLLAHDVVSTISPAMIDRLLIKGVSPRRIIEIRNWADVSSISPLIGSGFLREKLSLQEDELVVLYSGSMAEKQGLETVASAARILEKSEPNIKFILCGQGPFRAKLEHLCLNLSNVVFLDLQPKEMLGRLLGSADIHILPQKRAAADLVLPSKLSGILASGKPVICGATVGSGLAREMEGAGIAVEPEDPVALAEAILSLANDNVRRKQYGVRARELAMANWNLEKIVESFETKASQL